MGLVRFTLSLPPDLVHVLDTLAREQDITTGHLIRSVLSKEISRRKNARPPIRADERLVAPLRARLAEDLATAPSWPRLQASLRQKGYELHQAGGGLALHSYPHGQRVCKASELGFSYSRIMRRLNAPFPGHTHTHLWDRVQRETDTQDEPLELIEPF